MEAHYVYYSFCNELYIDFIKYGQLYIISLISLLGSGTVVFAHEVDRITSH